MISHVQGNVLGMSTSFNAAGAALRDEQANNYVSFKQKYELGKCENKYEGSCTSTRLFIFMSLELLIE